MNIKTGYFPFSFTEITGSENKPVLRACVDEKKTYFFFKRIFDIVVSFLFIVFILSWFLPLMALLIKIDSKGPVFFLQKRIGRGGRIFTCYKLRTMILNREADEIPASENDVRITRIGGLIRKANIDEFPQFFNILLGSMSVTGPRPHMIADCNRFSSLIPGYKFRNFVKPGITGLAQIKGFHGPAIHFEALFLRYQWDAFYVRNANFLLDLRIMRKTIFEHIHAVGTVISVFFNTHK